MKDHTDRAAMYPTDIHTLPQRIQKRVTLAKLRKMRKRCRENIETNLAWNMECPQKCYVVWRKYHTRRHPFGENMRRLERYCPLCGIITLNMYCPCCRLKASFIYTKEERAKIKESERINV